MVAATGVGPLRRSVRIEKGRTAQRRARPAPLAESATALLTGWRTRIRHHVPPMRPSPRLSHGARLPQANEVVPSGHLQSSCGWDPGVSRRAHR